MPMRRGSSYAGLPVQLLVQTNPILKPDSVDRFSVLAQNVSDYG